MSRFTPINELPQMTEDGNGIGWQFQPGMYVDQDSIGLHTNRLRRILRVGGLGEIVIRGYYGDQTDYTTNMVGVTGVNEDGSATGMAGGAAVMRAESQRNSLEDELTIPVAYRWPSATVELNRNELADRVTNRIHVSSATRDERDHIANKAWATEMDHALRKGLVGALKKKHVGDFMGGGIFGVLDMFRSVIGPIMVMPPYDLRGGMLYAGFYGACLLTDSLEMRKATGDIHLKNRRLSLLPCGVQYDRWALASGMAATQRLIKYQKPQQSA